ncbi:MAG: phosphate ABC transporter substrate-binding protein, partial [Candidatus Aminicenantales bacterium]
VYATRDDIVKAIAGNIYPSPPARELYFVLKGKPKSALLAEFLTWVLTSGQAYAPEMGYLQIPKERAARGLAAIGGTAAGK